MSSIHMLRPKQAFAVLGRSRSCGYADIKAGVLPPFVKLGVRASGLPAHEANAINAARVAGKSAEEIRALVQRLIAERKAA